MVFLDLAVWGVLPGEIEEVSVVGAGTGRSVAGDLNTGETTETGGGRDDLEESPELEL